MSLTAELNSVSENFTKNAPPAVVSIITTARSDFEKSFDLDAAVKAGDKLPAFELSDALGKAVTSAELLAQGPVLISFYRGEWCPFCNLALRALQAHLDEFKAKGVTLVAITPSLPDATLSTTEKHELKFTVLSDVGNKFAAKLGILFAQPDTLRPVFEKFGHDLKTANGDDSLVVPVPATLLVDKNGIVRNTFIDPDYTKRLEPSVALGWVDALKA